MNKKSFTLIELLVVVLIIGILSGIALPQYMKSINRSRATEAWQAGKTLLDGEHMYFLENREYTSDTTQLRIQPNALKNFTIAEVSTNTSAPWYVRLNGVNAMADFQFTFILQADGTRQVACSHTQLAECRNVLPCGVDSMTDIASVPGTSAAGKACTL